MSAHQAVYPIATMCRVLGVSPSGYYAWTKRPPSRRATSDGALTESIRAAHAASHGTYGAPRIQVDLAAAGVCVSRKRIARLMRHGRTCRGQPPQVRRHHAARRRPAGARPGGAQLHGGAAGPAVGGRHHVHPDLGRLPLSGGRARCLQPPHRVTSTSSSVVHPGRADVGVDIEVRHLVGLPVGQVQDVLHRDVRHHVAVDLELERGVRTGRSSRHQGRDPSDQYRTRNAAVALTACAAPPCGTTVPASRFVTSGNVSGNDRAFEGRCLLRWAHAQAGGPPLRSVLAARGWSRASFYRHVTNGATRIARVLGQRGVAVC